MKRALRHTKELRIRAPASPKAQERALADMLTFMVETMAERWRNQVLKGMSAKTVEKFEDRRRKRDQTGNYANVYLDLAKSVRKKLERQFDDLRIEATVKMMLAKANNHNRDALYKLIEQRMGINSAELAADEGLTFTLNALIAETVEWAKKLRDETLEEYTTSTLRAMAHGNSLADVMKQFDGLVEKRKGHARFTARNQINNFNAITTKIRAQNLGIEEGIWVTARDGDRVRPSHRDRDGKRFDLKKGLYSSKDGKYLLPGTDYQCRCTYMLVIPEG